MNMWKKAVQDGRGINLSIKPEYILSKGLTSFVGELIKQYSRAGLTVEPLQRLPFGRRPGDSCMRDFSKYGFDGQAPVIGIEEFPKRALRVSSYFGPGVNVVTGLEFDVLRVDIGEDSGFVIYGGFMPRDPELVIDTKKEDCIPLNPNVMAAFAKLRETNESVYRYLEGLSPYPVKKKDLDDLFLITLNVPRELAKLVG